jgi:hypothetical protein
MSILFATSEDWSFCKLCTTCCAQFGKCFVGFGFSYLQQAKIETASCKLCNLIRWLCINLANLLCKMQSIENPTLETKI